MSTIDLAPTSAAQAALGRWRLLDEAAASPKESLAVILQILTHLPEDSRAIRAAMRQLAQEALKLRAQVARLEATEALTPRPLVISDDEIEAEAEAEVETWQATPRDSAEAIRADWAEISRVFDLRIENLKRAKR